MGTWGQENGYKVVTLEFPTESIEEMRIKYEPIFVELFLGKF